MSDVALVIDTRTPKYRPRPVGGGLDGPDVQPYRTARPDRRKRPQPVARMPRPEPIEIDDQPVAPVVELVPEPTPEPEPVAVTPPGYDPPPPPVPLVVARVVLDDITDQLAHLVPAHPGAHAADLIRLLALKLDGHRDCHQLINPAPGTLNLIEVRARCIALIDTLPRAERLAVVGLLADDLGSRP